tara:strand:+ start:834 stop:995 length:162 start_codon:yes stop_codon:yes gene_type:complete
VDIGLDILLGYTEGVSKGIFSIPEKTRLDIKTDQTGPVSHWDLGSYKKPVKGG